MSSLTSEYKERFLGMGKFSRDKGNRVDRDFVNKLKEKKITASRVPLSGAAGGDFAGDIILETDQGRLVAEVKCRKDGSGFKTIEKWLGSNDLLFLKSDRNEPLVVMSWDSFLGQITSSSP